ncbi:16S rRNA (guanine(966)-N(2))-methyltransferase RsmD [Butyrivibrio hungatei DSM 14810]|uniref:RNA methyltransferase RsmD family n=2 Tax=Butyrivibrio hungatei TaxID=185008 RepID=A0A1D9P1M7_9FIRM|nr:16S rRNA (guanine(966)-N(2))-methyltransferase RsmD [Butyrivibrio hungatei]AOZ96401.1 RNA methyltransferase RsmD family [Butyrivibrio hungatei]SHN63591.1 16S rRNA (guanine(966)-N(2))-methyltransferase RsmD [Butyrivibrio hungatei DSM 14810]
MRVIAGSARRLRLLTPEGNDTRPTQDRIKETLFNMIQNDVPGAVFIDLFAGSGGIGIEALSRGASRAYFIENAAKAYKCIMENLKTTHFEDVATVFKQDVVIALRNIHEKEADIIFIDPPYQAGLYERTLSQLSNMSYVTENTMIILESAVDMDFSFVSDYGFEVRREKEYKTNKHVFLYRKESL